jgi:hypothetical protein
MMPKPPPPDIEYPRGILVVAALLVVLAMLTCAWAIIQPH